MKEFYNNAVEAENRVAMGRGKAVPFDNVAINSYYNLEPIENDDYSQYVREGPNWDEVI